MTHRWHTKTDTRTTTERGYGAEHVRARRAALARYRPGDPCCLCGQPLPADTRLVDLDHAPDRHGYRGLAHQACNRRDGARRGNARRHRTPRRVVQRRRWL